MFWILQAMHKFLYRCKQVDMVPTDTTKFHHIIDNLFDTQQQNLLFIWDIF